MDVLAKSTVLVVENYAIRKNQGTSMSQNASFNNFIQSARIVTDFGALGRNDLLTIFRNFLNSILIRSGRPIITGGSWDMTPLFVMGYTSMVTRYQHLWDRTCVPMVKNNMYRFVNDATCKAGIPIATNAGGTEIIENGIRVSRTISTPRTQISFTGIRGIGLLREVGVYYYPSDDGDTRLNGILYGLRQAQLVDQSWTYQAHGGEVTPINNGEPFFISEGLMTSVVNSGGVWDLEVYINAVDLEQTRMTVEVLHNSGHIDWLVALPKFENLNIDIQHVLEIFCRQFNMTSNFNLSDLGLSQTLSQSLTFFVLCLESQLL